ncbi:MAG: TonB family protein [Elusimicrobia bacterium]|nr:TonB family protein [Elusimicrobiota bacterium]
MYVGAATIGTEEKKRGPRVPVALGVSLAVHALGLVGFMRLSFNPAEEPLQVIENVDLMVEEQERKEAAAPKPKAPPSMKDFLKMALPAVPKPELRGPLDVKLPVEERKLLDMTPKLEDKGRLKEPQKLAALDLDRQRPDLAKIAEPLTERREAKTLAALPKLEEVGGRQAPRRALQMAALAEADRGRLQPQRLDALGSMAPERRRTAQAAPLLPSEAAPAAGSSALSRLAAMLPSEEGRVRLEPKAAAAPKQEKLSAMSTPPPAPVRRAEAPQQVKRKAVEIEGPLSNRRIVQHSLPTFPEWAREMGLVEAEVQIKFYVTPDGAVEPDNMRVERTSGYGRLDRLAMQHLKLWRFQPTASSGNEWGIITFRFLLE